jgi:hypothetical protein
MKNFIILTSFFLLFSCRNSEDNPLPVGKLVAVGEAKTISPAESRENLEDRKVIQVSQGETSYFIGYRQVSSKNQNPVLVKFDGDRQVYYRENFEVTGDDGTGYGLLLDHQGHLYAVFSATGTQGTPDQDWRRFCIEGWLKGYGSGGGAKVAVVARLNPENGEVEKATFVSALLSSGNSNSLQITDLSLNSEGLLVKANSWYSPRRTDKSAMNCSGSSPFEYQLILDPDLSKAVSASATGCE